jgi:8-oxo-dGTP pyrophosphatase MutT (NUDIX family)
MRRSGDEIGRSVRVHTDLDALPAWWAPLAEAARGVRAEDLTRLTPPDEGGRASAVLILLGETPDDGPDVLLIERAHTMRQHAGQPAFPGGALDPDDDGPAAAAVREAVEETGVDPGGVVVVAELPDLWLPPTGFVVTPVLAWWRDPSPVAAMDPAEVARVLRVPLRRLADPANRFSVRHPSGYVGPAFGVEGLVVWGFTAGLLDRLLAFTGFSLPWDRDDVRPLHLPPAR